MKIDPNLLISQFIDYHTGVITDWVKWVQLERSLATYQNVLKRHKTIAVNDPYAFFEKRIDKFLTDYDDKETMIKNDYLKLINWFKENKVAVATRKTAVEVEVHNKRNEIVKMVEAVNGLANDLLGDCEIMGYTGDSIAFLEVLAEQDPIEVIAMYIRHS
jgi:hypothetical protein